MAGFNITEQGHIVNLVLPEDAVAAVSSEVINMENWSHATIVCMIGASASALTIVPKEATSFAHAGGRTFLPYRYAKEATGSGDTMDAALAAGTTAGVVTSTATGSFVVAEIDASALSDGYPYLYVYCDGQTTGQGAVLAILSGGRHQKSINATAIA